MSHDYYNTTNFPHLIASGEGGWDYYANDDGKVASIPSDPDSGRVASHFGDVWHLRRLLKDRPHYMGTMTAFGHQFVGVAHTLPEIDFAANTTFLSLRDVRLAHEDLERWLDQAADGDLESMYDLQDKIESLLDRLDGVLQRHGVVKVDKIGECLTRRQTLMI